MSEITARIDTLLVQSNQKRADLVRATGISEGTIRSWIKGSVPSVEAALKVAQYFNVSVEWLVTGKDQNTQPQKILSNEERELIEIFRVLDERDKLDLLENARIKRSHYSDSTEKNIISG